jgi:hypothetical protein
MDRDTLTEQIKNNMRHYTEVRDGDGHHLIIPTEKLTDWYNWIGSLEAESGHYPEYAMLISGTVSFDEFDLD